LIRVTSSIEAIHMASRVGVIAVVGVRVAASLVGGVLIRLGGDRVGCALSMSVQIRAFEAACIYRDTTRRGGLSAGSHSGSRNAQQKGIQVVQGVVADLRNRREWVDEILRSLRRNVVLVDWKGDQETIDLEDQRGAPGNDLLHHSFLSDRCHNFGSVLSRTLLAVQFP
jgi:hypothetical protein